MFFADGSPILSATQPAGDGASESAPLTERDLITYQTLLFHGPAHQVAMVGVIVCTPDAWKQLPQSDDLTWRAITAGQFIVAIQHRA